MLFLRFEAAGFPAFRSSTRGFGSYLASCGRHDLSPSQPCTSSALKKNQTFKLFGFVYLGAE